MTVRHRNLQNHLYRWFFSILLWSILVTVVSANSPVWKITQGDKVLYLAGTIHLLSKQDYPLPSGYERAYQRANGLVFETDLRQTQSPKFQQHLIMQMRYPYGETLKQYLSPKVYRQLVHHLKKYDVDINDMKDYRASLMSMTLTILELKKLGMAGTGVDKYFAQKAIRDKKPILGLETPREHIQFMATMGQGHEDAMILHSLEETQDLPQIMQTMKAYWRTGNLAGFEKEVLTPFKTEFPSIYRSIIVQRNQNWLPKIKSLIATTPVELVMVGNLHLVGQQGLLHQLAAQGYQIQQLP